MEKQAVGRETQGKYRRYEDWQTRLSDYLLFARQTPFNYNSAHGLDCCTFTFGAIQSMTGIDIGAPFRNTYRDLRGSLVAMKNYCGQPSLRRSIMQLMSEHEFSRVAWTMAQRGDAVLTEQRPNRWFLGILDLNGRDVIGVCDQGLIRIPISAQCMAWRIG